MGLIDANTLAKAHEDAKQLVETLDMVAYQSAPDSKWRQLHRRAVEFAQDLQDELAKVDAAIDKAMGSTDIP
jgi:hypothetical protein